MLRPAFLALIVSVGFSISTNAHTHVAEDGTVVNWYPKQCCDDGDCRSVRYKFVYGAGNAITHVKMFVAGAWRTYPIAVVRPSKDHLAHWCGKIKYYRGEPYLNDEYCKFAPMGQASIRGRSTFASSATDK